MSTTYDQPPVSPDEYLVRERAAEYKSEYYAGDVVAMSGASRAHGRIVANLAGLLWSSLRGGACEAYVADMRVGIADAGTYVYPDVAVVCGEARFEDRALDTLLNPTVLVEVLSRSTEPLDRGRKARAYRQLPSLREYVLVAQDTMRAEAYRRQPSGEWHCEVAQGAGGVLALHSLGLRLSLAEIYERVFPAG